MKYKYVITVLIFIVCMSNVNALEDLTYSEDGTGTYVSFFGPGFSSESVKYYNDGNNSVYIHSQICISYHHSGCRYLKLYYGPTYETDVIYYSGGGFCTVPQVGCDNFLSKEVISGYCHTRSGGTSGTYIYKKGFYLTQISEYPITEHTLSGDFECVDHVNLSIKLADTSWSQINSATTSPYSFTIYNDTEYKVHFSDSHDYIFTCTGDEEYNHGACSYMNIFLKDYCGNKMQNTSVDIYKSDGGEMSSYEFVDNYWNQNPIQILVDTDIEEGKMLDIYFDTDMGTYHHIDYCEEKEISILHPLKWWSISFGAFDDMTHNPIPNIKMVVNQTCKICPDRPLVTQGLTDATGYKMFTCLSAQNVNIRMDNDQYGGDRFFVGGLGDAFRTHHIIDTYLNLSEDMPDDPRNNTDNMSVGCNIKFKDVSGHIDNHINDTDTYVDLYYENGNCSATLKFQRLYGTYWMTKASYNIPALETGYKRIPNANFSTADACYRGIMTSLECECNATLSLYVTNETIEEEMHYENLTTYIRFDHQLGGGQVDYRSDVVVKAYAYTNTSASLLNINLTLYEQTNQIAAIDLDWADFAGALPKWYYTWSPNVNYDIGKNYTVVMTGYNGLNLCADDVWTSNIRNNKLTVNVQDNHNTPLAYSTVFIQDWGTIALNSATSTEIEGFGDDSHQYKATKSGYLSSGWSTIIFNNSDESVTCTLTQESTESVTGYKLKDDEVKAFFIPLMYMLLIMILIGGLLNAAKP